MGVYIKGMEPPSGCRHCMYNKCSLCTLMPERGYDKTNGSQRREDCPMIPVPDHGDLIDAQVLHADLEKQFQKEMNKTEESRPPAESYYAGKASGLNQAQLILNDRNRQIIIPAERSEE